MFSFWYWIYLLIFTIFFKSNSDYMYYNLESLLFFNLNEKIPQLKAFSLFYRRFEEKVNSIQKNDIWIYFSYYFYWPYNRIYNYDKLIQLFWGKVIFSFIFISLFSFHKLKFLIVEFIYNIYFFAAIKPGIVKKSTLNKINKKSILKMHKQSYIHQTMHPFWHIFTNHVIKSLKIYEKHILWPSFYHKQMGLLHWKKIESFSSNWKLLFQKKKHSYFQFSTLYLRKVWCCIKELNDLFSDERALWKNEHIIFMKKHIISLESRL